MSCNHAYVNFKFQPIKYGVVIIIFSSLLLGKHGYCESRIETKFIVTYLSCLLQEKQGYFKSRNILNYEVSFNFALVLTRYDMENFIFNAL
jgi:hypothetical protein